MKQFCITTAMGKRLIGKGMAKHPKILDVLEKGTLVIIAGTTNGYVAEEVLEAIGQAEGFTRVGFRRGVMTPAVRKAAEAEFLGDVVIEDGKWQVGKSIFDVVEALKAGDVILKGGNAYDPYGQAGVLVGSPEGGTVHAAMTAVYGRRVQMIVPVGVEKRIFEDIIEVAKDLTSAGATGLRLYPVVGEVFTELDAIELLSGAEARMISAGGIYGAEGSAYVSITGTAAQEIAATELVVSVMKEPACEV